jgi:hypothetical protein
MIKGFNDQEIGILFWRGKYYSFLQNDQTTSLVRPSSSSGRKGPKRVPYQSPPPTSIEIQNSWSYTSIPPYTFTVQSLIKPVDNITFTVQVYYCCCHHINA